MSVSLNPSTTLGFNRPLTELVKRTLTITNPNELPVAFKVKTTAPKLYCVRPNSGRIEAGQTVEVSVQLQPMKEEPPLNAKCKDKFLVQSTLITPDKAHLSQTDLWALPAGDGEHDLKVHQHRLKVVYLPPEGVLEEEPEETTVSESRHYETVREAPSSNGHAPSIPTFDTSARRTPPPDPRPPSPHVDDSFVAAREEQSRLEQEARISPSPEPRQPSPAPIINVNVHTPPPAAGPQAPSIERTTSGPAAQERELLQKLAEAQEEIQRLRNLLAQTPDAAESVRQRRGPKSDDGATVVSDTADAVSEAGTLVDSARRQEGLSPQQAGIIALLVFVITYLFF